MTSGVPMLNSDFHGRFGDLLCLSHEESCLDENGRRVSLMAGMHVTVFSEPRPERLVASGVVEPAPPGFACRDSHWVLRLDSRGIRKSVEDALPSGNKLRRQVP